MFPTGRDDTLSATGPIGGAMPRAGRNEPCPCGSHRKVKRCCGQQRGPSEDHLARAHIAILAREAAPDIADLSDYALDDLWKALLDLPAVDISLADRHFGCQKVHRAARRALTNNRSTPAVRRT